MNCRLLLYLSEMMMNRAQFGRGHKIVSTDEPTSLDESLASNPRLHRGPPGGRGDQDFSATNT